VGTTTEVPLNVRPTYVAAVRQACDVADKCDCAQWIVPREVGDTERRVAQAIASALTDRLIEGWSLEYAFRQAALGRDELARRTGLDRKTVAAAIEALMDRGLLARVGQLGHRTHTEADGSDVIHSGAYLYRLLGVRLRQYGDLASATLSRALLQPLRGMKGSRRFHKALDWAISNAEHGNRNAIGYWLTRRCIDCGLTEGDAVTILQRYVAEVDQSG
jgi:hypothetical protein